MKKVVHVAFEVDAETYEEARAKVENSITTVDEILSDTILLDNKEEHIRQIIGSCKVVNHVKF